MVNAAGSGGGGGLGPGPCHALPLDADAPPGEYTGRGGGVGTCGPEGVPCALPEAALG